MGAAAGARAWARAAGLGGGEANPTRPRSATIIPAPQFGRGGSIAGVDDSALRQRADLQALSAILLESWNESHSSRYENDVASYSEAQSEADMAWPWRIELARSFRDLRA